VTTNTTATFIAADATSAVQGWITTPASNNGFMIQANSGTSVQFDSKENTSTSHPATLTIVLVGNGPTGMTGTTGTSGANGSNGATGATGASGPAGVIGSTGLAGSTGATGATGVAGSAGATGANGVTGSTGANGSNGATGPTGANGTNGATGPTGANGTNGGNGTNGTNGATGPTGAAGQGVVPFSLFRNWGAFTSPEFGQMNSSGQTTSFGCFNTAAGACSPTVIPASCTTLQNPHITTIDALGQSVTWTFVYSSPGSLATTNGPSCTTANSAGASCTFSPATATVTGLGYFALEATWTGGLLNPAKFAAYIECK
jgi:hypothetical protein